MKFQYTVKFGVAQRNVSNIHTCFSYPTYFLDDLKVDVREDFTNTSHSLCEDGFK